MSARQNKKIRKGRHVANRERTVTTLTEDPNTPYLVPTPSEEPAGSLPMSSPCSVASSSVGNQNQNNIQAQQGFQIPPTFGFNFNGFSGPLHTNTHPQQQPQGYYPPSQQSPAIMLPPGKNDLEILEKLKEMIKNGQHEFYRAIPQPAALASLYLGPNVVAQVPPHPDQIPDHHNTTNEKSQEAHTSTGSGPPSPIDTGRRPPRMQNKDSWDSGTRKPLAPQTGSSTQTTNNNPPGSIHQNRNNGSLKDINTSNLANMLTSAPASAVSKVIDTPTDAKASPLSVSTATAPDASSPQRSGKYDPPIHGSSVSMTQKAEQDRLMNDRLARGDTGYGNARTDPNGMDIDKGLPYDDVKDELSRPSRDMAWSHRDGPPSLEDRRPDLDRSGPTGSSRPGINGNSHDTRTSGPGERGAPPGPTSARDDKFSDHERDERDRDRDRFRKDWQYDRDRDRRLLIDRARMTDTRRPPLDQRYYEPDYDRPPVRRYEPKGSEDTPISAGRLSDPRSPSVPAQHPRPPPPDDDRTSGRAPGDSRPPDFRAPDSRVLPPDTRQARSLPMDERHGLPLTDDHAIRSVARPTEPPASIRTPGEDRARVVPPLEKRITLPSIQDRSQPPTSESDRISRQGTLEERLSHPVTESPVEHAGRGFPPDNRIHKPASNVVTDRDRPPRPGAADIRSVPPNSLPQDDRALRSDDRPVRIGERYTRPVTPTSSLHRSTYPQHSPARDDGRPKVPISPILRPPPPRSDYRPPGRDISRERTTIRPGNYRPESDRPYHDDRRPDAMDLDGPPRYTDNRPYRHFSPPSAADLSRDRARQQQPFPPSPPRAVPPLDTPTYDTGPRRFQPPGARDWEFQPGFESRNREWGAEEEPYWKDRPSYERNLAERERFDREREVIPPHRNHIWEARPDRDAREPFSRGSPPRPLSARLTDGYPGPVPVPALPEDRGYPPLRETDRGRAPSVVHVPPYGRVRPRSPSPPRRPGPPPVDDSRPPLKRQREEYPATEYYPPGREPLRRAPGDYPPRSGSPPPPSSGNGYYDRSGPPPPSASTGTSIPEREYGRERGPPGHDYQHSTPAAYDRPRSPGPPPRINPGYSRGGYVPRERGYMPPPPRTS